MTRIASILAVACVTALAGCRIDQQPLGPRYVNFQSAGAVVGQANFADDEPDSPEGQVNAAGLHSPRGPVATFEFTDSTGAARIGLYVPDTANNRVLRFEAVTTAASEAVAALGQPDLRSASANQGGTAPTAETLEAPQGAAVAGSTLVVADTGNNRVLIWNAASLPDTNGAAADVVIGQPDMTSAAPACSRTGLDTPTSVHIAGDRLFVADAGNNRVLVFNDIAGLANGDPADLVLGQTAFNQCLANRDGQPGADTLAAPEGVWSDGGRVIVADTGNNRVLIWSSFPDSSDGSGFADPADIVLGQPDMTTTGADTTDRKMRGPTSVTSNGSDLAVADTGNSRVLVWNTLPDTSFAEADAVLGQQLFTNSTPDDFDQDGTQDNNATSRTMEKPAGVANNGSDQLLVSDTGNHRVLLFTRIR